MSRKLLLMSVLVTGSIFSACAGRGYYVARTAPPPPRIVGSVGSAPGPGYVWIEGNWNRRGNNWAWVGGSWVDPSGSGFSFFTVS